MPEPLERLSPSQHHLLQKVMSTSRVRADALIQLANLSLGKGVIFEAAREVLEQSRIVINLNLHEQVFGIPMITSILRSRRLYNVFEIAHAGMATNPTRPRLRLLQEFKNYGGGLDVMGVLAYMSNTEHPNYGMLDYKHDPVGISMLGPYGWYRFVLKPRVRGRSTFTPADSSGTTAEQVFVWADIDGILASRVQDELWFRHVATGSIPITPWGYTSYIEAQILGGVLLERDVEALYYPETDQFNTPFFEELKKFQDIHGIGLEPY